jgi:hypothetical protein
VLSFQQRIVFTSVLIEKLRSVLSVQANKLSKSTIFVWHAVSDQRPGMKKAGVVEGNGGGHDSGFRAGLRSWRDISHSCAVARGALGFRAAQTV